MPMCASVYMCLVVTCWESADLLAVVCGIQLCVCHSPMAILGQVWYLIVPIADCYVFVRICLYVLCGHLLAKGWPLGPIFG